ncbi:hypothetical protein [Amycolatopsis sp. cmx-4-68]|uniref:hypothetical protein n=1 Tax=Amycolatopsis sp. cmx-4-68 TaxID=2790938 RepID=UPI0039792659
MLDSALVASRRQALEEEAASLGIDVRPGMFQVMNASDLAAWAREHPALAVSPLLEGIGQIAHPFSQWSNLNRLGGKWIASPSRDKLRNALHEFIAKSSAPDFHVEGVSGTGKTRAVLEAIRGQEFEPLVAYVSAADDLPPTLLGQLQTQKRRSILVVDNCSASHHERLAAQLPTGTPVKLITIGESDGYRRPTEPFTLERIEDEPLREILRAREPNLWAEHARFVVDAAAGNIQLALLLASAIAHQPDVATSTLITPEVIKTYVTRTLPDGQEFIACCILALFTYFGHSDQPAAELNLIASAFDMTPLQLRAAARHLADAELLNRQGCYRSVSPHPLAIYLAARGWEELKNQIVTRLVPHLPGDMVTRLFQRAVDIGNIAPIRTAVAEMLRPGGIYEDLKATSDVGHGFLFLHLAALAPGETCTRIESSFASMSDDQIADCMRERPMIRAALERIAWRPATFERASSTLLRCAVASQTVGAELCTASRKWADLFGAMLPTTAAAPSARVAHLRTVSGSDDPRRRWLAIAAAKRGLTGHETAIISSETQGGILVERRGRPATWGDLHRYREDMTTILALLTRDDDSTVASDAGTALINAMASCLPNARTRSHLARAIVDSPEFVVIKAHTEVARRHTLHERMASSAGPDDEDAQLELRARIEALEDFRKALPDPTAAQSLESLLNSRRWDFPDDELQRRITETVARLPADQRALRLLDSLRQQPAAAYEAGYALGGITHDNPGTLEQLSELANSGDDAGLVGYLHALVKAGNPSAFDQYLDSDVSTSLNDAARLRVSVRGPINDAGWDRVVALSHRLEPADGARGLLGWHQHLSQDRLRCLLTDWIPRITTQDDFNAVVDLVHLALPVLPSTYVDSVDPLIDELLRLRTRFDELARLEWDWEQLGRRQLSVAPQQLLATLLDIVETGTYYPDAVGDDENLLRAAVIATGAKGWTDVMLSIEHGSHQARLAAGRWLGATADVDTERTWVGDSLDRARLVASVTHVGDDCIDPVAMFLITDFAYDEQVAQHLRDSLIPSFWVGSETYQHEATIDQVRSWLDRNSLSATADLWTRTTVDWLSSWRDRAALTEEEDDL